MDVKHTLLKEIEDSKRWFDIEKNDGTYKRDLAKRIKLINWVLENMRNPDIEICELIESKINENRTYSILEADQMHTELRILDWIFFQVCSREIKKT